MADQRIVNEIVFETDKAGKALASLSRKLNLYKKDLIATSQAEDKATTSAKRQGTTLASLVNTKQRAINTEKQLTAATNAATAAARKNTNQVKQQKRASDDLGLSWLTVKRIFTGQIIFRALSAITNQMRDSVGVAQELGIKLAEAITIAPGSLNLSVDGISRLGKEIRNLSESFGVDQVELATAAYQVYSNQIGNATESTIFLEQAVLFAKATVTDTANAVDLLSGVINSYGLEAGEAARVSDVFVKAVELGRFRIDDIANSMGRVNPIAAQLGIRIEEVAAALATLTIKGVSPDKAITQLLAVMLKMVKPSKALSAALNEIGFANIKQATSTLGLVGTLKKLIATTDGTIEAVGRMFPRVRAIQSVMGLVSDEGERFDSVLKEITETAKGATRAYADFILATDAEEFKRNVQAIKNFFVEDFGKSFIKTTNQLLLALGGIPGAVDRFSDSVRLLAAILGALALNKIVGGLILLKLNFQTASTAAMFFGVSLKAIPFAKIAILAAAAGFALGEMINWFVLGGKEAAKLAQEQKDLESSTKALATTIAESAFAGLSAIKAAAQEGVSAVQESIRAQIVLHNELSAEILLLGRETTGLLLGELKIRLKDFEKFTDNTINILRNTAKAAEKIDAEITKILIANDQLEFQHSIRFLDKESQLRARAARVRKFVAEAELLQAGDQQKALLKIALDEARSTNNKKLILEVNVAILKSLRDQKVENQKNADILIKWAPALVKARGEMKAFAGDAKAAAADVDKALGNFDKTGALAAGVRLKVALEGFEDVRKEIEAGLGKALGGPVATMKADIVEVFKKPLPLSVQAGAIFQQIEDAFGKRPLTVELQLKAIKAGIPIDKNTTLEQLSELFSLREKDIQDSLKVIEKRLVENVPPALRKAALEVSKVLEATPKPTAGPFDDFLDAFVPIKDLQAGVTERREILKLLELGIRSLGLAAADDKGLEKFPKILNILNEEFSKLKGAGLEDLTEAMRKLNSQFRAIEGDLQGAKQLDGLGQNLKKAKDGANDLSQVAPGAARGLEDIAISAATTAIAVTGLERSEGNLGTTAQTASTQAVNALNAIGPAARNQIGGVQALAAELRALAAARSEAAVVTAATGGQIPSFLAAGGPTQSRGTDTVAVQAAPGEFFVNAASSRRFIPELTAINQGRAPEPRNNSQTTNNSFSGDININTPSGAKMDGRRIAQDIRRELRRKTSSLS